MPGRTVQSPDTAEAAGFFSSLEYTKAVEWFFHSRPSLAPVPVCAPVKRTTAAGRRLTDPCLQSTDLPPNI